MATYNLTEAKVSADESLQYAREWEHMEGAVTSPVYGMLSISPDFIEWIKHGPHTILHFQDSVGTYHGVTRHELYQYITDKLQEQKQNPRGGFAKPPKF